MESTQYEHLFKLEEELLLPDTRKNTKRLQALLDDSFFEFGSSGKVWVREATLNSLPNEEPMSLTATDFAAHELTSGVVLITYKSERRIEGQETARALRSSIWKKTDTGWRMFFHQGTPTAE